MGAISRKEQHEIVLIHAMQLLQRVTDQGECAGNTTVDFFANDENEIRRAKLICDRCPIQELCLNYSLHFERYGIWGGVKEGERKKLRNKLGIKLIDIFSAQTGHNDLSKNFYVMQKERTA